MHRSRILPVVVALAIILAGCAHKNTAPVAGAAHDSTAVKHDSTTAVDTAAHPAAAHDSTAVATDTIPPAPLLMYAPRVGKVLYTKYCSVCHGDDGTGNGFNAYNLDPKPRDFTDTTLMNAINDQHLIEVTSKGGRGVNRSVLMPSWEGRMTPLEISYVVAYIRTFAKHGGF